MVSLFTEGRDGQENVDAPLPRDGITTSQSVGCAAPASGSAGLRVVKHDVEGHALGAGLKAQGLLERMILADLPTGGGAGSGRGGRWQRENRLA